MPDNPLNIAFMWHLHQPYFKGEDGQYHLPWVRFHGTRDYLDMLLILQDFPGIKQNINLVPSLIKQLDDYTEHGARDQDWLLTEIEPQNLSIPQKQAILKNFFAANTRRMIRPFPRYYELYLQYKYDARYIHAKDRVANFSDQDFRDLQVWYNLTWIGQVSRQRPKIKKLFEKGRDFTEKEKSALLAESAAILKEIIPTQKKMWDAGQIELSCSPMYHPILPLLIDNNIARKSNPDIMLPSPLFSHPEDARQQMLEGIEYFEKTYGRRPKGIWPPEGGVSTDTLNLIAQNRAQWIATDEAILKNSLRDNISKNRIYQPHLFRGAAQPLTVFFRDHYLSDTIGFVYGNWDSDRAAADFIDRLKSIRQRIVDASGEASLRDHIVPIIIDGRTCWEAYPDDGKTFLRKLYQRLSEEDAVKTCTFSDFLERKPKTANLSEVFPGSWVNHNFNIWIGAEEDNRAWQLLKQARDFLVEREKKGYLSQELSRAAWEHIYIAEASDWCWWFGDNAATMHEPEFDKFYREHLMRVYEISGGEIPSALFQAIKKRHSDRFMQHQPRNFIQPVISGTISHFYEWVGAAVYRNYQSSPASIQASLQIIDKLHVGFDKEKFYFRIDFNKSPDMFFEFVIAAKTPRQITLVISPLRGVIEKFESRRSSILKTLLAPNFKMRNIFEGAISFKDLGLVNGETFGFQLILKQNGQELEILPHANIIEIDVPDENYEQREWSV